MCSNACDSGVGPCDSDTSIGVSSKPVAKVCRRCGDQPYILIDKVHLECKACFLESCNKKIRSTIGRSRALRNNDPILLAYSGGPSSRCLLDLIHISLASDLTREQKFRPSILHVDVHSSLEYDCDTLKALRMKNLTATLRESHDKYPTWPIYWTALEMITHASSSTQSQTIYFRYDPKLDITDDQFSSVLNNIDALKQFSSAITSLPDLTTRQQYIHKSTKDLIDLVAYQIAMDFPIANDHFKSILYGTSAAKLSVDLMVNVILGEGASIPSIVGVCDARKVIPILRPMREFSDKEIAFYMRARDIDIVNPPDIATLSSYKSSVQKCTDAFLTKLQNEYPSTFSTLLKTGNKFQDV